MCRKSIQNTFWRIWCLIQRENLFHFIGIHPLKFLIAVGVYVPFVLNCTQKTVLYILRLPPVQQYILFCWMHWTVDSTAEIMLSMLSTTKTEWICIFVVLNCFFLHFNICIFSTTSGTGVDIFQQKINISTNTLANKLIKVQMIIFSYICFLNYFVSTSIVN